MCTMTFEHSQREKDILLSKAPINTSIFFVFVIVLQTNIVHNFTINELNFLHLGNHLFPQYILANIE